MLSRQIRRQLVCLMAFLCLHAGSVSANTERVEVTQSHMGMPVTLTVWGDDADAARAACAAAFERVAELNMVLSDYEPHSELSALCRRAGEGPVKVSEELLTVLAAAKRIAELSDGLLDPTAAPVIRLWREARRQHRLPDEQALADALDLVGHEKLKLDPAARTAELTRPGMRLDLGAVAKGYIGDEALRVLREHGFGRSRFSAGGDVVVGEAPPDADGWRIEPEVAGVPSLSVSNAAVAVSGDTVQYVEIAGRRYSHVIDPRDGQAITSRQACVVRAPSGLVADPLATLGTLLPPEQFEPFVAEHFPEADVWQGRPPATRTGG